MEASIIGKSEENPPIPPAADAGAASPPLGILLDDVEQSVADSEARDGDAAATTAVVDPTSEADAALDSILETSVAEVNLALSHHDASTAAAAAAIADAAFQAADIALQAAAVDAVANIDPNTTSDPAITTTSSATTSNEADRLVTEIPPQNEQDGEQSSQPTPHELEQQVVVAASAAAVAATESTATDSVVASAATAATPATATLSGNKRSLSDIMHDEKKDNLVKNLNMNVVAAGPTSEDPSANANAVDSSGYRVGRWTLDEKILFLFGLQKYGKGRWKKISTYVPQRYGHLLSCQCVAS
jgi:Myb-like DNA-binding domain